ncbi:BC85_0335 family putative methyltransferase [Mycoplasma sp. 1654_15]|uniref:BC85_0335 family putative methyltransferase n=1 Tax=Mycoplasma sp. 1654_15 TaxID=2725994 RepID=UPI001449B567|nr:hypothetical protein [Mycoplasma sp. 1654_15]QJB70930.1 hypothetical protein HF996_00085 [Mycoplasma sp. 1654_15]
MQIPNWLRIVLIASIFVSLAIGAAAIIWSQKKKNKIVKQVMEENRKITSKSLVVPEVKIEMDYADKLLNIKNNWVIEELEFIINTINLNNFKNNIFLETAGVCFFLSSIINKTNNFIFKPHIDFESFKQQEKLLDFKTTDSMFVEKLETNIEFFLIDGFEDKDIIDTFDLCFKNLKKDGLIIVRNISKKSQTKLVKILKSSYIKYEIDLNFYSLIIKK